MSYVYKNIRNEWSDIDVGRLPLYTVPFNFVDVGDDGVAGTADDQTLTLLDRPATAPEQRSLHQPEGLDHNADFNTVEVAAQSPLCRQMDVAHLVRLQLAESDPRHHVVDRGDRSRGQPARQQPVNYRPCQLLFGDERLRERSTNWNYKVIGRYVMPWDIGVLGILEGTKRLSVGPRHGVPFPGDGAQNVRMEPVTANRAPNVAIMDFRDRQVVQVRQVRQDHRTDGRLQLAELGHGHHLPHDDQRDASRKCSAFSTRASCASACASTSNARRFLR